MTEKSEYIRGFEDGLRCMAHMKDGVYYVGTIGLTLKEAIQMLRQGKLWNCAPPAELKIQSNSDVKDLKA